MMIPRVDAPWIGGRLVGHIPNVADIVSGQPLRDFGHGVSSNSRCAFWPSKDTSGRISLIIPARNQALNGMVQVQACREMILDHLAETVRNVEAGQKLIVEQRARVELARGRGFALTEREATLKLFEEVQALHEMHGERLRAELRALTARDGSFVMPSSKAS